MTDETARPKRRFSVDSLFADTRPQAVGVRDLTEAKVIDLDRIDADPDQPRHSFDDDRLSELAASIRIEGILQPIVVRFDSTLDRYIIVHGERRWRASKMAGVTTIPAIVRHVPVERRLLQQIMENVVRDDLNAIDRAAALRTLKQQLGDPPWEDVAEAVGIKRSRLFQLLGTEKLTDSAQEDIRTGRLSEKQSRALQGLTPDRQEALRQMMLSQNLSATEAQRLGRAFKETTIAPGQDASVVLEQLRSFVFGTTPAQVRAQSRALLGAIREAQTGTRRSQQQLTSLASTLGAGRFQNDRFAADVNRLARSLANIPTSSERQPEVSNALRELRDALDSLIADS